MTAMAPAPSPAGSNNNLQFVAYEPSGPLLGAAVLQDNTTIQYFGDRDASNIPIDVNSANVGLRGSTTSVTFNSDSSTFATIASSTGVLTVGQPILEGTNLVINYSYQSYDLMPSPVLFQESFAVNSYLLAQGRKLLQSDTIDPCQSIAQAVLNTCAVNTLAKYFPTLTNAVLGDLAVAYLQYEARSITLATLLTVPGLVVAGEAAVALAAEIAPILAVVATVCSAVSAYNAAVRLGVTGLPSCQLQTGPCDDFGTDDFCFQPSG